MVGFNLPILLRNCLNETIYLERNTKINNIYR